MVFHLPKHVSVLSKFVAKTIQSPQRWFHEFTFIAEMASRQLLEVGLLLELGITCGRSRSAEADRTRRLSIPQPSYLLYDNAHNMAPNLAESQHALTHDMILSGTLSARQMANVAGCSKRTIHSHRLNMHYFGSTRAPPNGAG